MKERYVIGVDLGGTKIAAALVNLKGKVIKRLEKPTNASKGKEEIIKRIVNIISEILNSSDAVHNKVEAIGFGSGGAIDYRTGTVLYSTDVFPDWIGTSIKRIFERKFGLHVFVDNDVKVATLGEQWFGAGQGVDNFVCICVGTGISSGIVINGELYRGSTGYAGEIGHHSININGPQCNCGNYGCLDIYAGGMAVKNKATSAMKKGVETKLNDMVKGDLDKVTAEKVFEAAQKSDRFASSLIAEIGKFLGVGIANVISILNPELVIIGGGLAQAGDLLLDVIRQEVKIRTNSGAVGEVKIVQSPLGKDAGVIGAAALAMKNIGL